MGMYGTNPEDAGTGTIHACLLGSSFSHAYTCPSGKVTPLYLLYSTLH